MDKLLEWFAGRVVLVALSGGVDSALVAYAAHTALGARSMAATADYRTLSAGELESAREVARQIGISHHTIRYDELSDAEFVRNGPDRCYHCRNNLGYHLRSLADSLGCDTIVDGTHADDTAEWRPGMVAVRERGIRSPLLELSMTKGMVRHLAKSAGLAVHDKPSDACLASRVPWGRRLTAQMLARIEMGERYVRRAVPAGHLRVRDMSGVARIEVDVQYMPQLQRHADQLREELVGLGFDHIEVAEYTPGGANR